MNNHATPKGDRAPIVVKYGGNAMTPGADGDPTLEEIARLWKAGTAVVLVHGGGPAIDQALEERGIIAERIDGLRVTSAETLAVTEAVLCGTLNKQLVRACIALGLPAVGISGEDANTLVATQACSASGADLGYVGEVASVDPTLVNALLDAGLLPVVAPLAISTDAKHAFNVNADLAAAALAGALKAKAFVAITNVARVLRDINDASSGIDHLTLREAQAFAKSDACQGSMKPKLDAAIAAIEHGATASYICNAKPNAIAAALGDGNATIISR